MADALHFVDANGLRFAYLEEGTGPLVLMLYGFPDTAHTWDDLRSRIAMPTKKRWRATPSRWLTRWAPARPSSSDTTGEPRPRTARRRWAPNGGRKCSFPPFPIRPRSSRR